MAMPATVASRPTGSECGPTGAAMGGTHEEADRAAGRGGAHRNRGARRRARAAPSPARPTAASTPRARKCGKESRKERGYTVIFDGSRRCFAQWAYSGGASMTLQRDGTLRSGPGAPGLGTLWFKARPYGDFSLRLQFRDDAPAGGARANSGVQVRFPAPKGPVPGCGDIAGDDPWIAVRCGHEIQINDNAAATRGRPARSTASRTSTARRPSRRPPASGTTWRSRSSARRTRSPATAR